MPTIDEQRAAQLENAKADAGFWAQTADMLASGVEDQKGLRAVVDRAIAEGESGVAEANAKAKASQQRIEQIERGENVTVGFSRPDFEVILRAAGFTKQDIRDCEETHEISEAGLFESGKSSRRRRRSVTSCD